MCSSSSPVLGSPCISSRCCRLSDVIEAGGGFELAERSRTDARIDTIEGCRCIDGDGEETCMECTEARDDGTVEAGSA